MTLLAIKYENKQLEILDQLKLPFEIVYIPVLGVEHGWKVIKSMQVRGAPAIAIVGCLSMVVELAKKSFKSTDELRNWVVDRLDYLVSSRPTAVNMRNARNCLCKIADEEVDRNVDVEQAKARIICEVESMLDKDVSDNKNIGKYGAEAILKASGTNSVNILTCCNTGSLATAGYGTALGVVRYLHEHANLKQVYFTETRPYNQGARLTAFEVCYEHMPHTLICDNMAGWLMKSQKIDAVVVGADHVVANGDTANKIGTYALAVLAKHHNVPFYVAAPTTSINIDKPSGDHIVVENRPAIELTHINNQPLAAPGVNCWNPAFDVTPANLITGIITEYGVYSPGDLKNAALNAWK